VYVSDGCNRTGEQREKRDEKRREEKRREEKPDNTIDKRIDKRSKPFYASLLFPFPSYFL
jgi:hypothetical protein